MDKLRFVILAKSYKPGGRCVAGKLIEYTCQNTVDIGNWVRPVSDDGTGHGSLKEQMYRYDDGTEARILDIVEVGVVEHIRIPGQPENFIIDKNRAWKKLGTLRADLITNIVDGVDNIWLEDGMETNVVTAEFDRQGLINQSLCLIKPDNLLITLSNYLNEYEGRYKRKIVAGFDYAGTRYENLSVTCPSTRRIFTNQYPKEGSESITLPLRKRNDYVLCLSLSPRFGDENHHYKLVTTVFDYDGYLQRTYMA